MLYSLISPTKFQFILVQGRYSESTFSSEQSFDLVSLIISSLVIILNIYILNTILHFMTLIPEYIHICDISLILKPVTASPTFAKNQFSYLQYEIGPKVYIPYLQVTSVYHCKNFGKMKSLRRLKPSH